MTRAVALTGHGAERLFGASIMPSSLPFDIDALDLDRPETWPRDAAFAHALGELIVEAIETDALLTMIGDAPSLGRRRRPHCMA